MGSSSSFIVGLLKGLHALDGNFNISSKKLAKQAIKVERVVLAEPGGVADQIFVSSNTGLSAIDIETSGEFEVKPISISRDYADYFASCLTLVYIGGDRETYKISEGLNCPTTEDTKLRYKEIAYKAKEQFEKCNIFDSGGIADLLESTWLLKRGITPLITNDSIEACYNACNKAGARAFKLLGSGAGGFAVVVVRPEEMRFFKESIGYKTVDFKFDYQGSQVVFNSGEKHVYTSDI